MKRIRQATLTAAITTATALFCATGSAALAQVAAQHSDAPMVKSPETASGAASASNPDNMPIKRPRKATNDKMMHDPPASSANAK